MFTNKFKITLGALAGLAVAGGLGANQLTLQKEVKTLENRPVVVRTVVVSPTATPSATPTATLKFKYVPQTQAPVTKVTATTAPVKK